MTLSSNPRQENWFLVLAKDASLGAIAAKLGKRLLVTDASAGKGRGASCHGRAAGRGQARHARRRLRASRCSG